MRGTLKTAVSALANNRFKTACKYFSNHQQMRNEMIRIVKGIIKTECNHIVKPIVKSILRKTEFTHYDAVNEMQEYCPVSLDILSTMANCKSEVKKKIKIGNCFSILINTRNKNCNAGQKVNSILMYKGKVRTKV